MNTNYPDPIKFIILARYRSGSNLIMESLNLFSEIKIFKELFNLVNIANDPASYLDQYYINNLYSNYDRNSTRAVGFKLMYGQALALELDVTYWGSNISGAIKNQIELIRHWLKKEKLHENAFEHLLKQLRQDREIKIIHLVRSNQLESYISLQLALKEDNWSGKSYKSARDGIVVNIGELDRYFIEGEHFNNFYSNLFNHHELLEITYNELKTDYNFTLNKILDFININTIQKISPPLTKQNSFKMNEIIINYDQVFERFKQSRWKEYFYNES